MATRMLQILNLPNQKDAANIILLVFAVNGVNAVDFIPGPNQLNVEFDEDLTSPQEIAKALENSGHPIGPRAHQNEKSGCCGGCCS